MNKSDKRNQINLLMMSFEEKNRKNIQASPIVDKNDNIDLE